MQRIHSLHARYGLIPAWLLTTAEYRTLMSDTTWTRVVAPNGGFAFRKAVSK